MSYRTKMAIKGDTLCCVYSDELVDALRFMGSMEVARASHVEPVEGGWIVDLSPIGGSRLGPYKYRKDALEAEYDWITRNIARIF